MAGGVIGFLGNLIAPWVALVAAWVLYGVLGKGVLGADDDLWNQVRRRTLPVLDRIATALPGGYAERRSSMRERVGVVHADLDEVERLLMSQDYTRNPLASLKTNPKGWTEDGSWARRYRGPRWFGTRVRRWANDRGRAAWPVGVVGRLAQAVGDVVALRQVHVTLFRDRGDPSKTWLYAHTEPNALNPLVAWRHYRAAGVDVHRGVGAVRRDLRRAGLDLSRVRHPPDRTDEPS